ncbi:M20 metallopeptidase family protein [Corynebacterium ulceribovis]|uniref:M20 metallopeptidase family protein n=1 Tax=Corynebacterium ulceribovis TaxID=487732 RepID=UPI000380417B|nr:amidohydrolase [Corynebacterium ulceribovis]
MDQQTPPPVAPPLEPPAPQLRDHELDEQLSAVATDVIAWRRRFHQHPELSFQEHKTAAFIEQTLQSFGIETFRPTETSVVGTLRGDLGDGPIIGFRADIDALPITEETGLPFASMVPGVMHACGHDAHTAMLLGAAKVLASRRHRLRGRVVFMFQHAEEQIPGGARELVQLGVLDGMDYVYAFHMAPHPVGTVGLTRGRVTTISGIVDVTVKGRGTHSSRPQLGVDPVLISAEITMALNTIVSRDLDPSHTNIVNVGSLHSGAAGNVIPDTARLEISMRSIDEDDWDVIRRRIDMLINGICTAHGATADIDWKVPYPMVVNDDTAMERAWEAATKILGSDKVFRAEPWQPSDDFAYMSRAVPGCYMFLGGGGEEAGHPYFLHNSKYDLDETALHAGTSVEVQLVLDLLGDKPSLRRPMLDMDD